MAGDNAILLPLVGETWRLDPSALQALPFVMEARRLTPAYRLASRAAHPENTVVTVGDVSIGADFCLIAGPCAVESAYQMDTLSRAVKDAGRSCCGWRVQAPYLALHLSGHGRAGRRSAGAGRAERRTAHRHRDQRRVPDGAAVRRGRWQVGARNMQNFALLKALGQARKPILLKRGAATLWRSCCWRQSISSPAATSR